MAYAATRRKRNGQYGREKFYSLVIHGCPRITGSLLHTGPVKFRSRECTVTRREKILVIGAVSFEVSDAFPTVWHLRVFLFALCFQTFFLSFTSFCLRYPPLFRILLFLASMSRTTFVCSSNSQTTSELTRIRKFHIA